MQTDHDEQQRDGRQGLVAVPPAPVGPNQQADDDHPQAGREVAMNHLVQRFAELRLDLRVNMPITAGPIRAPEAGIGESNPSSQHDDRRREQRAQQGEPPKPKQASLRVHVLAHLR